MLDAIAYATYGFGVNELPEAMAEDRYAVRATGGVTLERRSDRLVR